MADRNTQVTIEILNESPIKGDGGWEIAVWVIVKRGSDPIEGVPIRFLCGATEVGSDTTNSDGRTNSLMIVVPIKKTSVQIEILGEYNGQSLYKRKEIFLPRPSTETKRADEWSTRVVGSDGDYTAYISVTGQNQLPLPGVLIHVYADRGNTLIGFEYTNNDGLVVIPIKRFTEPFKDIIIEAVGTRLKPESKRLYRRKDQKPPPIPAELETAKPTSGLRGLFGAFWSGWEAGKKTKPPQD